LVTGLGSLQFWNAIPLTGFLPDDELASRPYPMKPNRSIQPVPTDKGAQEQISGPDFARDCQAENAATFDFEKLAAGANCILIRFGSNLYSLRKTRTGRLVLNK
jgi:hemin uptake protein HemP